MKSQAVKLVTRIASCLPTIALTDRKRGYSRAISNSGIVSTNASSSTTSSGTGITTTTINQDRSKGRDLSLAHAIGYKAGII